MSQTIEAWVIVLAAATAFLVLIQVIVLAVMGFALWRAFQEYRAFQRRLNGEGISLYQFVVQARELLDHADKAVQQGLELGVSATSFVNKSAGMLNHAEESVNSMRHFLDSKWARLLRGPAEPVYQVRAVAAGVRSVVGVLNRHTNGH